MFNSNKNLCPYKDADPLDTVSKIREILIKNDFFTTEVNWKNSLDKIFSCSVKLTGLPFQTNGKGLSMEYALASAYGEFMERLQSYFIYSGCKFSPKDKKAYGFYLSIDEKRFNDIDSCINQLPKTFKNSHPFTHDNKYSLYNFWIKYVKSIKPCSDIIFLPYYDVLNDTTINLPYFFIRSIYGSNGLAAGNTPEEAIGQGINEIFERYVMKSIYYNNITPPIIPNKYLENYFLDEYKLIKELEKTNKFKITVRDCSLGKGLPVIGISFFDTEKNTCFVRFGADPDLKVALQRCITELFQGMTLNGLEKMVPFSLDNEDLINNHINYNDLCCTGSARFSNSFFLTTPSYPFNKTQNTKFCSLKDKLFFSLDIIKKLGYDNIYIRDFSFLQFPSYQIIIPGLSECFSIPIELKEVMTNKYNNLYLLANISNLTKKELSFFAKSIENYKKYEKGGRDNIFFSEYIKSPIHSKTWQNITLEFFLSLIYYKLHDYNKAYKNISIYILLLEKIKNTKEITYYYCVRAYFALLMQDIPINEAQNSLKNIFHEHIVNEIIKDLNHKKDIFKYIPKPKLWDCDECKLKNNCRYDILSKFYLNLKKAQVKVNINQSALRVFFHK